MLAVSRSWSKVLSKPFFILTQDFSKSAFDGIIVSIPDHCLPFYLEIRELWWFEYIQNGCHGCHSVLCFVMSQSPN